MATEYYLVHCCQLNSILYLVCLLFYDPYIFVVFKSLIFNISSLVGFFAAHGSYAERLRYIYIYIYIYIYMYIKLNYIQVILHLCGLVTTYMVNAVYR